MLALGITAGIGTAFAWAISATLYTALSRKIGVQSFMLLRQPLAAVILLVLCLWGNQFQIYSFYAINMAIISGIIGIVGADWCLYESIFRIGIRPAFVCQSLSTCCTALLGVIFLQEYLGVQGIIGIITATLGVIMVIASEQKQDSLEGISQVSLKQRVFGVILALTSALALAIAFIGSKEALNQGVPALMLTFMRNTAASILLWALAIRMHRVHTMWHNVKVHPETVYYLLIGSVFGPVGGIWLSSVALEYAPAAVAATLIGLQPVALLFVTGIMERRCPSSGSILGSCIACIGAGILLLR